MTTGEKIKYFRNMRGISQETLGQLSGINSATIKKYEYGIRNPKPDQLLKIANALGISINIFMDFDIETVSDVLSLLFKLDDQIDMKFEADKDDEGNFKGKADMFTKRTIKKAEVVTSVDTASEALAVSLSEKARVDLDYMAELTGKDVDTVKEELTGIIFQNPLMDKWETADEYLSGNVRDKLETAKVYAESHPEYAVNVQALTQVQPKELDASEIEVRIGATWIAPKYIEDFMRETFETPQHLLDRNVVGVQYSDVTGQWNIKGKNADYGNSLVNMTYGTSRRNAYTILEDSLNLKDSRVFDTIEEDGKEKRVLNKKETTIASQKQEAIREAFKDWVFRDPERRLVLVAKYNQLLRIEEELGTGAQYPGKAAFNKK